MDSAAPEANSKRHELQAGFVMKVHGGLYRMQIYDIRGACHEYSFKDYALDSPDHTTKRLWLIDPDGKPFMQFFSQGFAASSPDTAEDRYISFSFIQIVFSELLTGILELKNWDERESRGVRIDGIM